MTLLLDGKPFCKERGELQLTDYGISGIPVFQLSRYAVRALAEGKIAELSVNFFPEYTTEELTKLLDKRRELCPYQSAAELLVGLLPDKHDPCFPQTKGSDSDADFIQTDGQRKHRTGTGPGLLRRC